jgi:hypothetical protein
VTRFGEFSPIWAIALGNLSSFLNDSSSSNFWASFFLGKSYVLIMTRNSSGHPHRNVYAHKCALDLTKTPPNPF